MEQPNGIDLFLFAESCYQNEMPEKTPYLVLENKFAGSIQQISPKNYSGKKHLKFLISGTLTQSTEQLKPSLGIAKFTPFIPAQACGLLATFPWIFIAKLLKIQPQMNPQFFSN